MSCAEWPYFAQPLVDLGILLARSDPTAPKHRGISYLLVDMHAPGIEVRPLRQMTGDADFNEVFLNGARTPKDWIVGKCGEGWLVSRTTLKHERNSIGNADLARMQFDALVKLAKTTRIDGRPAIEGGRVTVAALPRCIGSAIVW